MPKIGNFVTWSALEQMAWQKDIVQADSPHVAELDAKLANATQAIAYGACGNARTFGYSAPEGAGFAPSALISLVGTWTSFSSGAGTGAIPYGPYELPWRLAEGYRSVGALMTIVVNSASGVGARLRSDDAIAGSDFSADSTGIAVTARLLGRPTELRWRVLNATGGGQWSMFFAMLLLDSPSLPASRRIRIRPEIQVTDTINNQIALGANVIAYVKNLVAFDIPDLEIGL